VLESTYRQAAGKGKNAMFERFTEKAIKVIMLSSAKERALPPRF
jgi:ATP-dependent Clp protease ATP-binding subunit ClpC